jgi:hypothetical protein
MDLKLAGISLKSLLSLLTSKRDNRKNSSPGQSPGSDLEAMMRISDKVFGNVETRLKVDLGTRPDA